ncbi:MAG: hypothetical protein GC191_01600 [Azospirillum sp.]|nr:hypothetical protein [Azospirillum sp.]
MSRTVLGALAVATLMLAEAPAGAALAQTSAVSPPSVAVAPAPGELPGNLVVAEAPAAKTHRPMGEGEWQGVGCLVSGGGTLAWSVLAGPSETIMLIGGGLLVPSGSWVLMYSLLTSIAATGCAVGAVATPTVMWAYDQWDNITELAALQAGEIGRQIDTAFRPAPTGSHSLAAAPGAATTGTITVVDERQIPLAVLPAPAQ